MLFFENFPCTIKLKGYIVAIMPNDLYEKNIEYLSKKRPGILQVFRKSIDYSHIKTVKSKTGHEVPVINGIHLHSRYGPIKEAAQCLKRDKAYFDKSRVIVVIGWGFAYHINEIIASCSNVFLYVFEADPSLFFKSLEYIDIKPVIDKGTEIILGRSFDTYNDLGDAIIRHLKHEMPSIYKNMGSYNLHREYYDKLIRKLSYLHEVYKGDHFSRHEAMKTPFDSVLLNNIIRDSTEKDLNLSAITEKLSKTGDLTLEELAFKYLEAVRVFI